LRWGGFAQQLAPHILDYYQSTALGQEVHTLLDVCCGTGQLAIFFLEQGYEVTGIDLSPWMLEIARERAQEYLNTGQARLLEADATDFTLEHPVGLAVSTFDALNHLPDVAALGNCFSCVFTHLLDGGTFIFDLNTRLGLKHRWNGILVDEGEELTLITRGVYDGQSQHALTRVSGFIRNPDGYYKRFEETVSNTVFEMTTVRDMLLDTGWRQVHFARFQALAEPIDEPEKEERIFLVASK
jgi:SAM-dependent methyltransferase